MAIPVLFVDLDFTTGNHVGATSWDGGLERGKRCEITTGTTVVVTDGEDAFYATVVACDEIGPHYTILWDSPASLSNAGQ